MTQIPMDRDYTDILGIAVYSFVYYEGMVLSTLYKLDPGYYVSNRSEKLMSGKIANDLITCLKRKKGRCSVIREGATGLHRK